MHRFLTYFIASVWLVNGLVCKVLGIVPRHEQIVARILGEEYGWLLTKAIGTGELLIVIWILSGIRSRFCAVTQIALVATMNVIEFFLAPDLLLFGSFNSLNALVFIGIVFLNEFALIKDPS